MIYLRQSYKIKPQRWGSDLDVRYAIFQNAERIGINPTGIYMILPMWSQGAKDYSKNNIQFSSDTSTYDNNEFDFDSATKKIVLNSLITLTQFSAVFEVKTDGALGDGMVFGNHLSNYDHFWLYDGNYIQVRWDGTNVRFTALINFTSLKTYCYTGKTGQHKIFVNGGLTQTLTTSTGTTYIGAIGAGYGNAFSLALDGKMKFFYLFNYVIPDSTASFLSTNPYYLLQRVASVFYSVPASGPVTFKPYWASQATRIAI